VNLRKDHFHAIPHRVHSVNSQAFYVALRRTLGAGRLAPSRPLKLSGTPAPCLSGTGECGCEAQTNPQYKRRLHPANSNIRTALSPLPRAA